MNRYFSLGTAAFLGLTLMAGTPSFGKGGGHAHGGGSGHSSGHSGGHPHSSGHGGGHAHSSGHTSGAHHGSTHSAPNHPSHPQLAHKGQSHPQPTHNHPAPSTVAGQRSTSSHTVTHSGSHWHHDHHDAWAWGNTVAVPWGYDPYWNAAPGVVVVPEENQIVETEYVTRVAPPSAQPVRSLNSDESDLDQAPKTP
jgi:hypothetical protein